MISVCMATYNGERFVEEQLTSIVNQLSPEDEIIISDDGSTDKTLDIVRKFSDAFLNLRIIKGPGKGVIKNFENAIAEAKGDIIFLSDQDDIWVEGKVKIVLNAFADPDCHVVVHDAQIIDGTGKEIGASFFEYRGSKSGLVKNFVKNSYIGCCMAFRSDMRSYVLPMPERIEMHDWWIGMLSEIGRHSQFIKMPLLKYRRHGENVSNFYHHPLKKMVFNRIYLFWMLIRRRGKML